MMLRSLSFATLCLVTTVALPQQPNIARDFVLTDNDAVGLMSPRVVCGSITRKLLWSTDGSVLLAHRMDVSGLENQFAQQIKAGNLGPPPPTEAITPKQELVFYSARGNKVKTVVPLGSAENQIQELTWVPGSQQVFVLYERFSSPSPNQPVTSVAAYALISSEGRIQPLAEFAPGNQNIQAEVSPTRPLIAMMEDHPPTGNPLAPRPIQLKIVNTDGKALVNIQQNMNGFTTFEWGRDGNIYLTVRSPGAKPRTLQTDLFMVDLSGGKLTPIKKIPAFDEAEPKSKLTFRVVPAKIPVGMGSKETADSLVLASTGKDQSEFAIVSTDANSGVVAPTGEYVAYISRGIAMVRPLVHIPKQAYLEAKAAAKRTELLSNAKQAGVAFLIYAADYDDVLPTQDSDWRNNLDPYLKRPDILSDFVYAFKGGNLTDVEDPAGTVLGYINGPGGKAVVYVDGHAKWQNDPPKGGA